MSTTQQFSQKTLALAGSSVALLAASILLYRATQPRRLKKAPKQMKQAFLIEGNPDISKAKIEIKTVDTPMPKRGQVLVKVAAAPVNPSDDGVWKQVDRKNITIGNECSGVVVASGGGVFANALMGKKVAVIGGSGSYAQYIVGDAAKGVFSLPKRLPVEAGCAFFVNPFTAVGIMESVRSKGGKTFIHTAGASQLGQMLVKLCKKEGMRVISVVRRVEQKELLMKIGADPTEVVVSGSGDAWKSELAVLIKEHNIKHAFDCISGPTSGELLTMLPNGGGVWVYGRLSDLPVSQVQALDLIYRGKTLNGFLVSRWITEDGALKGLFRGMKVAGLVRKHLDTIFASDFVDTTLEEMQSKYCEMKDKGLTGSKLRVLIQ
mmetsp:Transcript_63843/g.134449  ORF Transcript_63843/g.134449 Transcript_63843/m.134449 type:complete len:377 (+) Transcript_63843:108-1238(+)|eukprot:CAMPEP_0206444078 /NCGR_PEP_ID=MMETSP0324_2-20121206/14718_1 /ASSEMBLY_ACC=CAM_ASM_000836 /TAXON_ID=2866 /ORGANISM="Crypthecodinium cohnii, Strain Seligo" /LENGTH=376 /DNA_ID=CAMNT_0053912073 /DNA_START=68 /DNA_END=1198 /DNA_ORIENTATION=-